MKLRRQWLASDPQIEQQMSRVKAASKRKTIDSPSNKESTKLMKKKVAKKVKRETTEHMILSSFV